MFDKTKQKNAHKFPRLWNANRLAVCAIFCCEQCLWILSLDQFFTLLFLSSSVSILVFYLLYLSIYVSISLFCFAICRNFLAILFNLPLHEYFKHCQVQFVFAVMHFG